MRRLILCAVAGLLAQGANAASCNSNPTYTYTSRIGLTVPPINACSWGTTLNNDLTVIDSSVCVEAGTNDFTGANTFSQGFTIKSGSTVTFNSADNTRSGTITNAGNASGANNNDLQIRAADGVCINGDCTSGIDLMVGTANGSFNSAAFAVSGSSTNGTHAYSGFRGRAQSIDHSTIWSLPAKDGTNGQALVTDGTAGLSWADLGAGASTPSALGVQQNGVLITSPTRALNGLSPPFIITSIGGGATAQWALDGSSVTLEGPLLRQGNLWSGYNNFTSSTNFSGTINVSSGISILNNPGTNGQILTSGGSGAVPSWQSVALTTSSFIQNTSTLQAGASFYVLQGSATTMYISTLTLVNFPVNIPLYVNAAGTVSARAVRLENDVSGILPVANGGTGQELYLNGELLIGNTATGGLSTGTLTAGSGIGITNSSGTITVALSNPSAINQPNTGVVTSRLNFTQQGVTNGYIEQEYYASGGIGGTDYPLLLGSARPTDATFFSNVYINQSSGVVVNVSSNSAYAFMISGTVGTPQVSISTIGAVGYMPKTLAELSTIIPKRAGEVYYCSNCASAFLCGSTQTATANWVDVSSRTHTCF